MVTYLALHISNIFSHNSKDIDEFAGLQFVYLSLMPVVGLMLFASEVILRAIRVNSASPILISSLVAASVSRAYLGNYPAFSVSQYELSSHGDLGL